MKKHRWIIISLALWALIWLGAIGMRSLSQQTEQELTETPTISKPELEEVSSKHPPEKVNQYRGEIQKERKDHFLPKESDRKQRVKMAWSKVYQEENEKGDKAVEMEESKQAPEIRYSSSAKPSNNISQEKIKDSLIASPPTAGFHTQVISPTNAGTNQVRAHIFTAQEVRSGGAVKLKTKEALRIAGQKIPAGSLLIGTCRKGKRLFIEIKQVSLGGKLRQVDLSCLDPSDGQKGLIIQQPSELENELADAAVDEVLSQVPVGGGIIRSGKQIVEQIVRGRSKGKILLPHGYEIIISP